ncbi:beta-ketoacyl synthase N-terminal-like domain-containing protein [Gracilibacillus saliphilus]
MCSSSLTALHLACKRGEADTAIAGKSIYQGLILSV